MDDREENFNPQSALGEPLFEVSDVPAFTSTSEYELFRLRLVRFFRAEYDPAPHEYGRALRRILSSFKDPVVRARTQDLDIDPLILSDWVTTYTAFFAALDAIFQSPTILEDTRRKWIECKPRKHETPFHFLLRFEGATGMLVHIQKRLGVPPELNVDIVGRLLQVLPRYVVNYVRLGYLTQQPPLMIELQPLQKLRPEFETAWKYLPNPYISKDRRSAYTRNTTANGPQNNRSAANKTNPQCNNIVSYDSVLSVPKINHDRKLIFCPATIGWSVPELLRVCPECKDFLLHGCACNNEHLDLPRSYGLANPCHHFHIVFTDGACTNNGKRTAKAGIGIAFGDDVGSQLSIPITDAEDNFPLRSNQRAELCAAQVGLDLLAQAHTNQLKSEVNAWIIATDSEYVVKGITEWLPTWKVRELV
jgi:ribonuclease HI